MAWDTSGTSVSTTKDSASSVLFFKDGQTTIRQVQTALSTETRGLTSSAAQALVQPPSRSSGFTETTYYKTIEGTIHSFVAKVGTETIGTARRVDESDQWSYTETATTYALDVDPTTTGWTSSSLTPVISDTGVSVTISEDKTAAYQYEASGDVITSVVTTTVVEHRYLTATGKTTYMNQAGASSTIRKHVHGTTAYSYFNNGTDIYATARYISALEGWTVTLTTKVYSFTGTGWSLES